MVLIRGGREGGGGEKVVLASSSNRTAGSRTASTGFDIERVNGGDPAVLGVKPELGGYGTWFIKQPRVAVIAVHEGINPYGDHEVLGDGMVAVRGFYDDTEVLLAAGPGPTKALVPEPEIRRVCTLRINPAMFGMGDPTVVTAWVMEDPEPVFEPTCGNGDSITPNIGGGRVGKGTAQYRGAVAVIQEDQPCRQLDGGDGDGIIRVSKIAIANFCRL